MVGYCPHWKTEDPPLNGILTMPITAKCPLIHKDSFLLFHFYFLTSQDYFVSMILLPSIYRKILKTMRIPSENNK
jgi:hypothetical protein